MANLKKQQVHAGHTIKLKIDGQEVGRAQAIDGRRSFGQEAVHELGTIMPQEHVALRYEGTVTLDKYKVRRKSLAQMNLTKLGNDILNMDVIDIEVTDKYTNEIVIVYRGCSLQDSSENFRTNALSGENATWLYLSADEGIPGVVDTDKAGEFQAN